MPRLLFALVVAALLVAGTAAPAEAAKRKRTACERLAGRDLAPAPKLKVVQRERAGSITVRACTLKGGRVRTLAEYTPDGEFASGSIDVVATTDRYVLLAESSGERGFGHSLTRVNARTLRGAEIASRTCDPFQVCTGTEVGAVEMHRSGAVVAILQPLGPCCISPPPPRPPARVVLTAADGRSRVLDEGADLRGLALEGGDAVWSNGGQPRRAPIG